MTTVILTVFDMAADTSPPRQAGVLGEGRPAAEPPAVKAKLNASSVAKFIVSCLICPFYFEILIIYVLSHLV